MTDIIIDDLTNGSLDPDTNEWTGTGILDKLLYAINKNIEGEYNKNRITGSDYANVYLGAMQAALAQSMQYLLQEKVQEAQIDDIRKGIELKDAQLVSIEIDNTLKNKQIELAEIERLSKLYEKDTLLVDQHNQALDVLLTAAKQRDQITAQTALVNKQEDQIDEQILVAKQEVLKASYEVTTLLPDQHEVNLLQQEQLAGQVAEVLDSTLRANTELSDKLLTTEKQRILLDTEEQAKQYEVDNILPKQANKIAQEISNMISDTEFKDREVTQQELTSDKQREHLTKEIEILSQKKVGRAQ